MKTSMISRLALVLLISLALVGPAEAQQRERNNRGQDRLQTLDHLLDLSDEQKAQIKKIREDGKANAKAAREGIKADFEAVLTDEQKTELKELQSRKGKRFAKRSRRGNRFTKRSRGMRGGKAIRGGRSQRNGRAFRGGRSSQRGGDGMRGRGFRGDDRGADLSGRALRQLDLSDEQQEQIKALREEQQESMKALRGSLEDSLDERKEAMKAKRAEMETKVAEILTDEQEAKLKDMKEDGSKMNGRRGGRNNRSRGR